MEPKVLSEEEFLICARCPMCSGRGKLYASEYETYVEYAKKDFKKAEK